MADERLRTRSELKRLFTGLRDKDITDEMMSIAIDSLWRDKLVQRTSGFEFPAHFDSEISFDTSSRIFSIKPWDPLVEGFNPRFGIYSWSNQAVFHRIFDPLEIEIPDEEGLFCVYFDTEPEPGTNQILFYKKNPTEQELKTIYVSKVIVSFIYWNQQNQELLYFGDDRHGSEWNPQTHWYLNRSFAARRKTGLQFSGYSINGDGSNNNDCFFDISAGTILHDDIELEITETTGTIPILYFENHLPRFLSNTGFPYFPNCNTDQIELTTLDSGNFVIFHYFATNEIANTSRKIIAVMGISQYTSLQEAFSSNRAELNEIEKNLPMQGRCYIDSAIFQFSDDYTNDLKSRLIGFVSSLLTESHAPLTIHEDSSAVLEIGADQVLRFIGAPGGTDGREVEMSTSSTHIVWRYVGDVAWTDLVELSTLKGATGDDGNDGREVELSTLNGFVVWRYVGDADWIDLIDISTLQGAPGDDGREVEMRENAGWLEWRYVGDVDWVQLYEVPPTEISTSLSVTGNGLALTPVTLVNDAATPGTYRYYGTNVDGVKGFHLLPFSGDNVYVVYNETELLAAWASAIAYVGRAATIYIGAQITFTANRSFIRTTVDASITFYGIGTIQVWAIQNFVIKVNYVTFRNIGFTTTTQVYITVEGNYASFYSCRWWSEVLSNASFSNMKIAINCTGGITSGTGGITLDGVYHASGWYVSVNNGDIQPFIIQSNSSWVATDSLYINIVRFDALKDFDRFSRVLLVATANAAYKVTGDLTWYYHADQIWPGTGFIRPEAILLKKGSVDDLRADYIPTGTIIKVLGIDINKKIRQDTIPVPSKSSGAELNAGLNDTNFATAKGLKDGKFIGIRSEERRVG